MDKSEAGHGAPARADAYRFEVPSDLIAQEPSAKRETARLLAVLENGETEHKLFTDFPSYFVRGDVLVLNETRVLQARLRGTRSADGGPAEILLLHPVGTMEFDLTATSWNVLVRPGSKLRVGARVQFGALGGCEIVAIGADGSRDVRFELNVPVGAVLEAHGELPLPPYIEAPLDLEHDPRLERYQTVFSRVAGSVAAPTASLHFTDEILAAIRARGVIIAPLVLHIGRGTFAPIKADVLSEHRMHAEWYSIPEATAEAVAAARREGNRVIAAGTSVVRALESAALRTGTVAAGSAQTDLFITPGFPFRVVDALLTNFHMPDSPLIVLLSAFLGYEKVKNVYASAIRRRYRFFSFGDAMFVVRRGVPGAEPRID